MLHQDTTPRSLPHFQNAPLKAIDKPETKPLPKGSHFNEALLQTMADQSGGYPGVALSQQTIIPLVLRRVGINPDNLPAGWTKKGLWRQVRRSHDNRFHGVAAPIFKWAERGCWSLSALGIERINNTTLSKRRAKRQGKNATARFLDKRLRKTGGLNGTLWSQLRAVIGGRLPISASAGMVDDHIQNCWLKMVRLDALRTRIESGKTISDTHLVTYALRTAYTDLRDMGTEPVCREMYGTRTERERKKGNTRAPRIKDPRVSFIQGAWADVVDGGPTLEERLLFEELWMTIEGIIHSKKPKAGARYTHIVESLFRGFTVKEIASEQGVSPYRAASIIAEARKCVREAANMGMLAA